MGGGRKRRSNDDVGPSYHKEIKLRPIPLQNLNNRPFKKKGASLPTTLYPLISGALFLDKVIELRVTLGGLGEYRHRANNRTRPNHQENRASSRFSSSREAL